MRAKIMRLWSMASFQMNLIMKYNNILGKGKRCILCFYMGILEILNLFYVTSCLSFFFGVVALVASWLTMGLLCHHYGHPKLENVI